MGHIEIDAPDLLVRRVNDQNLLGRLDEIDGTAEIRHEAGNTRRHAARAGCERDFSGQHFVVVLLHPLLGPWLQVRIAEIGNPKRRLPACRIVGNVG